MPWSKTPEHKHRFISIQGASEHNLKSVSVDIPRFALTVVTGVSGSGKSSLLFDTLYRESERRYLESFSSHARQLLGKLSRPAIHHITGLSPAIAIQQKRVARNPRSTVGTMSEVYDFLRLFYARLGNLPPAARAHLARPDSKRLQRSLFSFNHPAGACTQCKGLGVEDRVDKELLMADKKKSLREGALKITQPNGYTIYSQVTIEVMNQVCNAHGFNVDIPWQELSQEQQKVVLYGSNKLKIPFGKHPLESRLKWSGITAKPREEGFYKGIIPVIENILRVDRNRNILRFARSMPCSVCNGSRLKPEALTVTFNRKNISQLAEMTIDQLYIFFQQLTFNTAQEAVGEPLRRMIMQRCELLRQLGLGYLTLARQSTGLSGGEAQRIRLCTQIDTGLRGILYTLDEPSIGLHQKDNRTLLNMLAKLRDNGNTVVMVEHDEETMHFADHLIDIGPGAGIHGGEILFSGPVEHMLHPAAIKKFPRLKKSQTRAFLTKEKNIPIPAQHRPGNGKLLTIRGASQHNLKSIDVPFRLAVMNVVTGVSGAGKSTLVHHILARHLKKVLHNANTHAGLHQSIEGIEAIDKIIEIDQTPIGRTPRSNPATYTKLFDHIRDLFAQLPESINRKWSKGRFSFNVKGGRCEGCEGAGLQQVGMHFLANVDVVCHQCGGKRFNDETLDVLYNGKSIYQVLEMSIEEASEFFKDQPKIHRFVQALLQLGLGYIALGQSATTLSGGEAQRVKLAAELSKPGTGSTLYILDEPSTGLHSADIDILLESLNRLVDKGNTVIIVEHHLDIIKNADWEIELGPGSGENGGYLTATRPPILAEPITRSAPVPAFSSARTLDPIRLNQVSTHNLKNIDVEIPVNQLTVITGVSGSGKSSLAFDTLFAEGRHRFITCFSTYARRMLANTAGSGKELESCSGMMPTIAVSQKSAARSPRSTVGTMTELLDYYRLLFSRAGLVSGFTAQHFSFNHHLGACPHCKGLGTVTVCDPEKLVTHPGRSLLAGAMAGSKTGKYYGDPMGQHIAILNAAALEKEIDFTLPWQQLDPHARRIAMYGTGEIEYDIQWQFKRKNREGVHQFKGPWSGFVNYVNQEYQRKHADRRGEAMLSLMTSQPCPHCNGDRLNANVLAVQFAGLNIAQLTALSVTNSLEFFNRIHFRDDIPQLTPMQKEISVSLRAGIVQRLQFLQDVGLDYLSLHRPAASLSGGEAQRIRLAAQLGGALTGVVYVLDEPTIGLHARDTQRLLSILKRLRDMGNTVVLVEHDAEIMLAADNIIDLGPSAGSKGGEIVASGSPAQVMANPRSETGKYLNNKHLIPVPKQRRRYENHISIKGAYVNNLQHIDIEIPFGGLTAITGVSGSGKSTLVYDVLAQSARQKKPVGCAGFKLDFKNTRVITMDQGRLNLGASGTPATYTGIMDPIRQLFSSTPLAIERNYKKNRFSFNVKGGRCETCQGNGEIHTSMDFLEDVRTVCETCSGTRYNEETLQCRLYDKNIADILAMTITEAAGFFTHIQEKNICSVLDLLEEVGLGYLQLGQSSATLSGGERQRLRLVTQLASSRKEKNLFLLDEPTTGLHFQDIRRLLTLIAKLTEAGHSVLVIEHHPDIIKSADHIIDLGPGGGDEGGRIVAQGTPEEVAKIKTSFTGALLAD